MLLYSQDKRRTYHNTTRKQKGSYQNDVQQEA